MSEGLKFYRLKISCQLDSSFQTVKFLFIMRNSSFRTRMNYPCLNRFCQRGSMSFFQKIILYLLNSNSCIKCKTSYATFHLKIKAEVFLDSGSYKTLQWILFLLRFAWKERCSRFQIDEHGINRQDCSDINQNGSRKVDIPCADRIKIKKHRNRNHLSDCFDLSKPINFYRSEERRVGKECRSRWSPYH